MGLDSWTGDRIRTQPSPLTLKSHFLGINKWVYIHIYKEVNYSSKCFFFNVGKNLSININPKEKNFSLFQYHSAQGSWRTKGFISRMTITHELIMHLWDTRQASPQREVEFQQQDLERGAETSISTVIHALYAIGFWKFIEIHLCLLKHS